MVKKYAKKLSNLENKKSYISNKNYLKIVLFTMERNKQLKTLYLKSKGELLEIDDLYF